MSLAAAFILQKNGEKVRPRELASGVLALDPSHFAKKKSEYEARSGGRSVTYQIEREIYARREAIVGADARIQIDASDGIRFFATNDKGDNEPISVPSDESALEPNPIQALRIIAEADTADEDGNKEKALYPNLMEFLADSESTLSMRINENRSSNRRGRNGNKWLHPDVVGMIVPDLGWSRIVRDCSRLLPTRKAKLVSIEVKLRLTSSDIRESFFQAVSNSQWANRAYLAATEIRGEDTWRELEMLCALHGVGYIRLIQGDPHSGRILIPAREREEVDWASANRIAVENEDFREYLEAVLNYLQTGSVVGRLWQFAPANADPRAPRLSDR
jgi:uncharacterized protein